MVRRILHIVLLFAVVLAIPASTASACHWCYEYAQHHRKHWEAWYQWHHGSSAYGRTSSPSSPTAPAANDQPDAGAADKPAAKSKPATPPKKGVKLFSGGVGGGKKSAEANEAGEQESGTVATFLKLAPHAITAIEVLSKLHRDGKLSGDRKEAVVAIIGDLIHAELGLDEDGGDGAHRSDEFLRIRDKYQGFARSSDALFRRVHGEPVQPPQPAADTDLKKLIQQNNKAFADMQKQMQKLDATLSKIEKKLK